MGTPLTRGLVPVTGTVVDATDHKKSDILHTVQICCVRLPGSRPSSAACAWATVAMRQLETAWRLCTESSPGAAPCGCVPPHNLSTCPTCCCHQDDRGNSAGCARSPHRTVALADAVLAHDVEDPQADGIAVAAAAGQPRQRQPREPPAGRVLGAARLTPSQGSVIDQ
jgi:hypothetical protein